MKNAGGGREAKGLVEYAKTAVDMFYKTAGSVAEKLSSPLINYMDSAIGNSRKSLSRETKAELIRDESGFGIKGSGAAEADILKYFIAKENAVRERFKQNGGSEKKLDEILSGIGFEYENSLRKMQEQMPSVVDEFLNSGKPSGGNPFEDYQNVPSNPDRLLVPEPDANFGGILKADIAGNEKKLGGAKPDGSLPDRFSVPDEHKRFGGVRKVQPDKVRYKRAVGGSGGKPIDGVKTEDIGEMESHFYDGLYKVYDVFDRAGGEILGGLEKLAKYASDQFMKHPYLYTAAIGLGVGGIVADAAFNNSKITKSAADYAKNPSKIVVSASGFIGGVGDLLTPNQPPVADLKIDTPQPWVAGEKIVFNASGSYDPDGEIGKYEWQIVKDGKTETAVTPTPSLEKVLEKGSYIVKARAFDGWGASGAAHMDMIVGEKSSDYDYYDADFKVGIMIEKYKEYPLFPDNVTRMLDVMKEKTPERYKEAMNAFKQRPKKIVKSDEDYNYASEKEIGLSSGIEQLGGNDGIKEILVADAYLYAEMMAPAPLEKPLKNRYEGELYQHSNVAKYNVDAGIQTKENMNEWLRSGYWFNRVEGRMPTPEDKEGVDIEKYLIQ